MRLLLLAGTGEARRLAIALSAMRGIKVTASLAGVTRQPNDLACDTRIGGFGGAVGFRAYLTEQSIDAVIDATHPFAGKMSETAAHICRELNVAHVQLLRPHWQTQAGDKWTSVDLESHVARHIPDASVVFLATGRQTLDRFSNLTTQQLICRRIDAPAAPFPFPNGRYLVGRPPFSVEDETALFSELKIDWLVVKNSGGDASRTKLDAARRLGIKVAMIKRPPQPDCERVKTVAAALAWAEKRIVVP